jgi:hypothetical protein
MDYMIFLSQSIYLRTILLTAGFIVCFIWSAAAHTTYLDEKIDRLILQNSTADTTRTKKEKLFKYRCESIAKYVGFDESPTGQAIKHSCDHPEVGIVFYAGSDLGHYTPERIAQYFTDELAKHHVKSTVFIKDNKPSGSIMGFYINGESWLRDPVDPVKGIEMIEALAAETLLILYTEKRIKEWPTGAKLSSGKKASQAGR